MAFFDAQYSQTMQLQQIQRIKRALEPLKKIETLSKKQKQELATKQLLQTFVITLNLQVNYIIQTNSQDLIAELANFLNYITYHQCSDGDAIQLKKENKQNPDIIILIQGSMSQISGSSTNCKIQKSRDQRCSRRKTQVYRWQVTDRQQPKLIKSIQQKYKLKTDHFCKYLQIKHTGYTHLLECISKIQKQFLLNFFNQWLNLDIEYVRYFRLHKNTEKEFRKRKQRFLIQQNYVYFVQKGQLLLTQRCQQNQIAQLILTKGSIINLESLASNLATQSRSLIAEIKSDVLLIKLEKQFLKALMDQNQWFKEFIQVSIANILQQRKIIAEKSTKKKQSRLIQDNQSQHQFGRLKKIPADKFRKCIGLKQQTKRFHRQNTSLPKNQHQQRTFFINGIQPFLQIVQSEQKVFERNKQQRPKKLEIYMLPDKNSRHYKNMRKRYYNQKVKELRVKNRAEDEIKCKNFVKQCQDCSNQMLQNSLFYEKICMNTQNLDQDEIQKMFQIKHSSENKEQNYNQGLSRRKTKFFGGARASKIIKLKPFCEDQNIINISNSYFSNIHKQSNSHNSRFKYRIFEFKNLTQEQKPRTSRQTKILKKNLSKRYNHFFTETIR